MSSDADDTDRITLTREDDEWLAVDENTGAKGHGRTREQALEHLDAAVARHEGVAIVKTPSVIGGKPRIEGTRMGVFLLGERVREAGESVDDLLESYPHLGRAEVAAALAYYDAHPEAMDVIRKRREAAKRRLEDQSLAPPDHEDEAETGAETGE
jgi:uncharacterized protein (DUF433 family)